MDWLDFLAVQGTLKSLFQHHSSKALIFWHSAFFTVQLSRPHMTTRKTTALTRRTFVGKVMSLLFDCGSDHELLIAKFRLKLKKVGKTTRPFRYDLNQIPYDYTVEVRNRFKGPDLIDRVPDELWTEVRDTVQETGIKTIPMEKKSKKAKQLS